jgi:hypothetical protein
MEEGSKNPGGDRKHDDVDSIDDVFLELKLAGEDISSSDEETGETQSVFKMKSVNHNTGDYSLCRKSLCQNPKRR